MIAYNVRLGLMIALAESSPDEPEQTEPRTHGRIATDLEEQMKAYGR